MQIVSNAENLQEMSNSNKEYITNLSSADLAQRE